MYVYIHSPMHIRAETREGWLVPCSMASPPYSFEIGSLVEPGACNFPHRLAGQQSPGILLFLPMHSTRVIGTHEHGQLFMWVVGSELGSSCFPGEGSQPLSHLPSHSL